jgi:N-acetylglucosamine-6-sulfatase
MAASGDMARGRPMWVQNQRNSWHGVEYPYHSDLDIEEYYKRYAESLLAVDESTGRILDALKKRGELDATLLIYMGDNGFAFGEHGLIDKRTAYEESMRVPMLVRCPELFSGGRTLEPVIANIDIMPTCMAAAGLEPPSGIDGKNFLPVAQGKQTPWRDTLLYEYYWERNYPQTPTIHALRGDRYKYVRYHGIWDLNELYDIKEDPLETRNLINDPKYAKIVTDMNNQLFETLEKTDGMSMPLYPDRGGSNAQRHPGRSKSAEFPEDFLGRKPAVPAPKKQP